MCSSTAPSVWNAVEIEIRGANRSSAHSRRTSGSSPSNSTASSPASRSSSRSTDIGLPSHQTSELVVGCAVAVRPKRLGGLACLDPAADKRKDDVVELLGRDAPEHRPGDRRRTVEAAAEIDVVRLPPPPFGIANRRALKAEVADPVLRARVRATVEVQAQSVDRLAEPVLEQPDEPVHAGLGLGDGEVVVRLPGAGDRISPQRA